MTNLGPDVTDFYLERVTPQGGYLRDGATVPLQTRQETIKVAGGDPVTITVRSTGHGPLLSDVIDAVQAVGRRAPWPRRRRPGGTATPSPSGGRPSPPATTWTPSSPSTPPSTSGPSVPPCR